MTAHTAFSTPATSTGGVSAPLNEPQPAISLSFLLPFFFFGGGVGGDGGGGGSRIITWFLLRHAFNGEREREREREIVTDGCTVCL